MTIHKYMTVATLLLAVSCAGVAVNAYAADGNGMASQPTTQKNMHHTKMMKQDSTGCQHMSKHDAMGNKKMSDQDMHQGMQSKSMSQQKMSGQGMNHANAGHMSHS